MWFFHVKIVSVTMSGFNVLVCRSFNLQTVHNPVSNNRICAIFEMKNFLNFFRS